MGKDVISVVQIESRIKIPAYICPRFLPLKSTRRKGTLFAPISFVVRHFEFGIIFL